MAFKWTNDLATGNATIDGEHQKLIKAADDLVEACSQGKGRQVIEDAVVFLVNYTKTHFAHEEELQQKSKFPAYQAHRAWHQGYIKKIEGVAAKLKSDGATIAMVAEVNAAVSELITHIKTMDVKIAQHIKSAQ
ncbi:MAG: bacteriohemerythrin [Oscillospiraceae bacterium]|jgi:hemerythrin